MTSFLRSLIAPAAPSRRAMNLNDWFDFVSQAGANGFPLRQTLTGDREQIETHFAGLVSGAYAGNGIVFAVTMTKFLLFSEARFQFQQMRGGRPGNLFGTNALALLETPEPGKTTGDLLARQSLDSDFAGNGFLARRPATRKRPERIKRMRPDWVSIVLGSQDSPSAAQRANVATDLDAEVIGYAYLPGGRGSGNDPVVLGPEEVSHFAPIPDPLANYRGMSPLLPVLRNIMGDTAATNHKLAFYRNGAPQPLDAKVMTPTGWTLMGAIEIGDRVVGRDGHPHEVTGVFPQGEQDIYRVTFDDGASTECTAEHLWHVQTFEDRRNKVARTMPLADIMASGLRYGGTTKHGRAVPINRHKWSVPLVEPVQFDDPGPLPMDPYLLGVMLGDGSFRNGAVTFSTLDDEIVTSVRELVPAGVEVVRLNKYTHHLRGGKRGEIGLGHVRKGISRGQPTGSWHPMIRLAKQLGLWNVLGYAKAVPEPYLRASVFDRESLLQGLIDTDGHVEANSSVRFHNTSEVLVRQVAELAMSLGGRARVYRTRDRDNQPNRRPQWAVYITRLPDWLTPVRLSRKRAAYNPNRRWGRYRYIRNIELVGRKLAQCIRVDSDEHLYVTDDYIVTHNTANAIVTLPDAMNPDEAQTWIDLFEQDHAGVANAYRTIYMAGGASAEVVGANLKQLDFRSIQGLDETRVAAAIGTHPVVAALSEGMQGSSLNTGNFEAAARLMGDAKLRPMWRNMAGSLETIIDRPSSATRLYYDDRDVPFLRKDVKSAAEIIQMQSSTISTLFMAGAEWDAVVDAVTAGDLGRLSGRHTGLTSVQLTPVGADPANPNGDLPIDQAAARSYRATDDFWPGDGRLEGIYVRKGETFSLLNPLVMTFPAMFEPVEDTPVTVSTPVRPAIGPGLIVSREVVLAKRAELQAAGQFAGYDSIARELGVHRDTVRRRLADQ